MHENEIGTIAVNAAIAVHRALGPGLFESVYEVSLAHELTERGLSVERQVAIPVKYKNVKFDEGFKADLIINDKVILELKSTERISKVHKKQLQTYLKLADKRLGYVLNFGSELLKDGIARCVNNLAE